MQKKNYVQIVPGLIDGAEDMALYNRATGTIGAFPSPLFHKLQLTHHPPA